MKFFVDECLSPSYVQALAEAGYPEAVHPRFLGLSGARDGSIAARAFAEDRIIITGNARDFRRIFGDMAVHPSGIFVVPINRDRKWQSISAALTFLELQTDPGGYMVNRVIEVAQEGGVRPYELASK